MSHLDEGTLHALLDGELELTEVKEIQAHLSTCAACGSRLREVREFLAESDRLVSAVQFPGELRPHAQPVASASPAAPAATLRERTRAPRAEPDPAPPVLLIPDNPDFDVRPGRWFGVVRWAAVLALAVGIGYLASHLRQGGVASVTELASKQPQPAAPAAGSAAVVSQEERSQFDSAESPPAAAGKPAPSAPSGRVNPATSKTTPPAKLESPQRQVAVRAEQIEEPKDLAKDAANESTSADSVGETEPVTEDEAFDRTAAAAAMAELDRERRLQRAKAATASLDAQQRQRQAAAERELAASPAPAAPPPAPLAPRTLEQRSQVYLRIGLDEAARQLGRPVHVIEGLSPAFMGLAQGRISPGADSTRPVVRVVYQDNQGRMIVLDQQRVRQGQAAPADGDSGWVYGDVRLSLFGEVGPEVLRNLRPRVR